MPTFPRISARQGQPVDLDVTFYNGGVPADPYAIRRVEIYRTQPVPHNLVATYPVLEPTHTLYPAPVQREYVQTVAGQCGTDPADTTTALPGRYHLLYDVPADAVAPDAYFDVWYYYPVDPCDGETDGTDGCTIDSDANQGKLLSCCHRFWVFPDGWFCNDGLQSVQFGFEPLAQKFHQPEHRPLELGLMPLPLYDYNHDLVNPLIPFLKATISIETTRGELLVDTDPLEIALRQGSYRSNPWVLRYLLDTTRFLKGTYQYRVLVHLPDGTTRSSRSFIFTVD